MNFRHVLLTVFVLCGAFSAAAQTLVIYDARDLFPKDAWNPPCKAVFTEDYYYSEEWLSLKDIEHFKGTKWHFECHFGGTFSITAP